jgi:hypothetical protein
LKIQEFLSVPLRLIAAGRRSRHNPVGIPFQVRPGSGVQAAGIG